MLASPKVRNRSLMGNPLARRGEPKPRHEHAYRRAILPVAVAEVGDEIALFEPNANEDIAARGHRKEQVPEAHVRRRPEGEDEAGIDRMAQPLIEERRPERGLRELLSEQAGETLTQAKQV